MKVREAFEILKHHGDLDLYLASAVNPAEFYKLRCFHLGYAPGAGPIVICETTELRAANEGCHRCSMKDRPGDQTYEVSDSNEGVALLVDVTKALAFAKKNLEPTTVPYERVFQFVVVNMSETFCGAHVEHVDRSYPAIIGTFRQKQFLMDGTHRLFGAVKHQEEPKAYILDEGQTLRFAISVTVTETH